MRSGQTDLRFEVQEDGVLGPVDSIGIRRHETRLSFEVLNCIVFWYKMCAARVDCREREKWTKADRFGSELGR